jgi:hypothetical protein
MIISLQEQGY